VIHAAAPHNLFPLNAVARRHVLIGGGIGITPLLAHMASLRGLGARFELHQFSSAEDAPLFERLLAPMGGADVHIHIGRRACDLAAVLGRQPLGSHVYTCGPVALMDAVSETAKHLGWPAVAVHRESFGDHSGGEPFTAVLARSHREIEVSATQSLLEAVEAAGVDAPYLCRGGACGQCVTRVIDGEPDHRDDVLSAEERAAGETMMICVSRAKTPRLVLDL
jgi:ferredoxin-NADP reductase